VTPWGDREHDGPVSSRAEAVEAVQSLVRGHWVSLAVRAAVDLGVPDALVSPLTLRELADDTGADAQSLARLLRVLVDLRLVAAGDDDRFRLTDAGRLLTSASDTRLASVARMRTALPTLAAWARLGQAVRTGQETYSAANGRTHWEALAADEGEAAAFNASMARRGPEQAAAVLEAVTFAERASIVDVGGGTGALLLELVGALPGSWGVLADRPEVVAAAAERIAASQVADRVRARAVDFMQAVPGGGDDYLLANVLHDWGDEDCLRILGTVRAAMAPGSRLLVVEHLLDDEASRSQDAALELHLLDLHMLVMFGARERSGEEYRALLGAAGFASEAPRLTSTSWQVVEARPSAARRV
jgi:hypothetical protein